MKKIVTVVGARPQFVKCAIVSNRIRPNINEILVHTGQHYDFKMSDSFFSELNIPSPDYNLNIGGMSHAKMTANMMLKLEEIIETEKPDALLTYGDTDSTLAAGLVASKLYLPLVHVEGGERIYQKKHVPEEINRVIVDHISDLNLCATRDAVTNLEKEGIKNTVFVGDPMFDLYCMNKLNIETNAIDAKERYGLPDVFVLLTIHRVENTLDENRLINILQGIIRTGIHVVWPIHPRTKKLVESSAVINDMMKTAPFTLLEPLPYIDFSSTLMLSSAVITDSGGVIRESYFANKFSIVPLVNSWWKNVVNVGWSVEVADDAKKIENSLLTNLNYQSENRPAFFGDGNSAENIKNELLKLLI
jgi:UDP-N-acetylglucosamine 2-epimerase